MGIIISELSILKISYARPSAAEVLWTEFVRADVRDENRLKTNVVNIQFKKLQKELENKPKESRRDGKR